MNDKIKVVIVISIIVLFVMLAMALSNLFETIWK